MSRKVGAHCQKVRVCGGFYLVAAIFLLLLGQAFVHILGVVDKHNLKVTQMEMMECLLTKEEKV